MRRAILAAFLLGLFGRPAQGQTLYNGSTGADGALDLAVMSCTQCMVQLPESGILNYTTINVPAGKTLYFRPNWKNTPTVLLAQGNVTIVGMIYLFPSWDWIHYPTYTTVAQGWPGPGGYFGGINGPGDGPGGGAAANSANIGNGKWAGPLSLVPIVGGSGGGSTSINHRGGGGGGAIVIATAGSINLSGYIIASGGAGSNASYAGYGSGGAIRLMGNSVVVTGNLRAESSAGADYHGIIRIEAPYGALTFTGNSVPAPVLATSVNPVVIPTAAPGLRITTIGGFPVPSTSGRRQDAADLLLPKQLADPIQIAVEASNIPVGTAVSLTATPGGGIATVPGVLAGSFQSSTATVSFSGASRTALTYLFVCATFDAPDVPQGDPPPTDRVAKIRLEAAPGREERVVFLRGDGSEIDPSRIPPDVQARLLNRQ